jgi:Mg2+-importing ATPase
MAVHAPARGCAPQIAAASEDAAAVLARLGSAPEGLSSGEAIRRRAEHGPNTVAEHRRSTAALILARAVFNPLVLLLGTLAGFSFVGGDPAAGGIMLAMLVIGVGLRFGQESRADAAVEALRGMVRIHATVLRDGGPVELPIEDLVPGDVVLLAAGDMVPADLRLLACTDLHLAQAVLTGESFPVEKLAAVETAAGRPQLELANICWLGTSVESGTGRGVVVATGRDTMLGAMSAALEPPEPPTAFDVGMARFTWLIVAIIAVLVPLIFLINVAIRGDWAGAALFALAVAVGLTPEMLPMIVAVCLSRGALAMARRRVIVKHVDSIQNLGAMDVLCTDKTGTLTLDRIILERHCDVRLRDDPEVLALAWLNSHFQTGLRSVMDRAILAHEGLPAAATAAGHELVAEIPFDFSRRLASVVVRLPTGGRRLISKGAVESLVARCTTVEVDGRREPLDGAMEPLLRQCDRLAADGFRVLAVAYRDVEPRPDYGRADERDMVLRGYVAFLDPPKDSARVALEALARVGVRVKVLTGDSELVTGKICHEVGIAVGRPLLGPAVAGMTDGELAAAAEEATVMARLLPLDKERIVRLLRARGHVVGFLGDGINDAPALRAADVGITVDAAVDIARESADCILLEKDLRVLAAGVDAGRTVFVNIVKYVRMGASSNFGNMLSVVAASGLLPFLPLTPVQVLANALLYDCAQLPIPGDRVDAELVAAPRPWSMRQIARFILLVGPCSSVFDLLTFAVMWHGFGWSGPEERALFRTGWFVESLVTQTLAIHVIRTPRIPLLRSRASPALTATTLVVVAAGIWLSQAPLGAVLGFAPLPGAFWPVVAAIVAGYLVTVQLLKAWLVRRGWIE